MTQQELTETVMALSLEEKQAFILDTLPGLTRDAMQDKSFLMQLLPVFLGIVQESGLELAQLLPLLGSMPMANNK